MKNKARRPRCQNCFFAGQPFKVDGKTHYHCEHPSQNPPNVKDWSPWHTLMEFWQTCHRHQFKDNTEVSSMTYAKYEYLSKQWNDMLQPEKRDLKAQLESQWAMYEAELEEFKKASTPTDQLWEATDVIWVGAWLVYLLLLDDQYKKAELINEDCFELHNSCVSMAQRNNLDFAHYLQATADSNWSKIVVNGGMITPVDHLDPKRFKKVSLSGKHLDGNTYCWIVGDDHQNPENIQRGKVLKPSGFVSKKDALDSILKA